MASNFKFQISNSRGFTLVEIIVVLSVFLVIIGAALGMFISIVGHQRRILQDQELFSQISYLQEYVSRATRSAVKDSAGGCLYDETNSYPGYIYLLTHHNTELDSYQGIRFITKDNICQEFFLDSEDGTLKEQKNGSDAQDILSEKFKVTHAAFAINGNKEIYGASQSDGIQPRVTFLLRVPKNSSTQGLEHVFQTTISQRNLNMP